MTGPLISVVIPAYNAEATIGACVTALRKQVYDRPYEIIVVDDGSIDKTPEVARENGATVITIPNSRPAAARNTGIRTAKGEIVCCTDADCVPSPNWLCEITAPFGDSTVAACKGTYTTRQPHPVARFVQLEYEDKYDLLRDSESIDFIDTYSAAYRRDVLLANDGFDECFDYLEDQELSFRLASRGYKMVFQPTAVVEHFHSATLGSYLRKKRLIGYWKAQVVRRFPNRMVKDSHTPQVMKVQMLVAMMLLVADIWGAIGGALHLAGRQVPGAIFTIPTITLFIVFIATTLPFVRKAWSKDSRVAIASPLLLLGRAFALGIGYTHGIIFPRHFATESTEKGKITYFAKRPLDVMGAMVGLIFTVIVWPVIALLIKLDSEGPVIFRQERVGERGQPFTMYKFRTMHVDASEQWPELVTSLGLTEPVLKLVDDPRLTRVGRFLRHWSLDELPQFWNVLKGEMSLVGPRPEEPRIVAYYTDYHRLRLSIKPGMTGPMQIDQRANLSLDERVILDLEYIDHVSLSRDISILLRTIPAVFRGKSAQ